MRNAGISVLPSIVNAALLTSAWSAGCADLFVSSRALYGLAVRGQAPKFLTKVRSDGMPWVCVLIGAVFSLLSFMAGASGKAGTVFGYCKSRINLLTLLYWNLMLTTRSVANMTAICGMLSWSCILYTGLRWQKGLAAQGIDRATLPYRAPFQPYLSYYGLCVSIMVLIFGGFTAFMPEFDASSFVTTYFPIPMFLILIAGYYFSQKTGFISYTEMDFWTGASSEIPNEAAPSGLLGKLNEYI